MKYILFILGSRSGFEEEIPNNFTFYGQTIKTKTIFIDEALPYLLEENTVDIKEAPLLIVYQAPILDLLYQWLKNIVASQLIFTLRSCFPETPVLILSFPALTYRGKLHANGVKDLERIFKESIEEIPKTQFLGLPCLWSLPESELPKEDILQIPAYSTSKQKQAMYKIKHCLRRMLYRNGHFGQ